MSSGRYTDDWTASSNRRTTTGTWSRTSFSSRLLWHDCSSGTTASGNWNSRWHDSAMAISRPQNCSPLFGTRQYGQHFVFKWERRYCEFTKVSAIDSRVDNCIRGTQDDSCSLVDSAGSDTQSMARRYGLEDATLVRL